MRCSCRQCGTYMMHSEGPELGCVCPECGERCKVCLGTNSVMSRDALKSLARNPMFLQELFEEREQPEEMAVPGHDKDDFVD